MHGASHTQQLFKMHPWSEPDPMSLLRMRQIIYVPFPVPCTTRFYVIIHHIINYLLVL